MPPTKKKKENDMPASPIEVAGQWLQNLRDAVAPDFTGRRYLVFRSTP